MADEAPPQGHPHPAATPPKFPPSDAKPHHKPPPPYPHRRRRDPRRTICFTILLLLLLLGVAALTLWLIYRPHRPRFRVISAAVYSLNTSSPPFVAASLQFTIATRNPSRRASLLYDPLAAHVAYRGTPITPPAALPPLYQEARSAVALSPLLGGGAPVPVPAEVANALAADEAYGVVPLRLVLTGRARYRAAGIRSGRRRVHVDCDLLVSLRKGVVGELPLLGSPPCNVDI